MRQDYFSQNNIKYIDYKDVAVLGNLPILEKFLNPNGKIVNHKKSGVTAKNQRALAMAIKHSRFLGLLPFVVK
jgi:small subunit ribosomal protein S18